MCGLKSAGLLSGRLAAFDSTARRANRLSLNAASRKNASFRSFPSRSQTQFGNAIVSETLFRFPFRSFPIFLEFELVSRLRLYQATILR
jgi:hypothetical protein